jgi:hypothetical protein
VVQPEELLQLVEILFVVFDCVEQAELALHQGLVAVGDAEEHPVDPLSDLRLLHGGAHRGTLSGVEGVGYLSDLVFPEGQRR